MGYDEWKTRVPDDDPEGEHQPDEGLCQDCGAYPNEPCEPFCTCAYCRRTKGGLEDRQEAQAPGKDAA